jgi:hypothetical protein
MLRCRVLWTQWALPLRVWWWPVPKDRAFGIEIGPVHLYWTRDRSADL